MADGVHEGLDGERGAGVAGERSGADVAQVVAYTREAEEAALRGELLLDLGDGQAELPVDVRDGEAVEVADAVVLRQAGLGAEAHAGADGDAVADAGDGARAAEVAGDYAQRRGGHLAGTGLVELAHDLGDVGPTEELSRALGDELVARAVEAVAAHAGLEPGFGHGVAAGRIGDPLIERGLEERDQRDAGEFLAELPDAGGVDRVVRRGEVGGRHERSLHLLIGREAAGDLAAVDGLEADRVNILGRTQVPGRLQRRETVLDGAAEIGHALIPTLGDERLRPVRETEQAVFERRRAEVGDEDVHRDGVS